MLELIFRVDAPVGQAIGVKEALALDAEKYGDVRVVSVRELPMEQLRMGFSKAEAPSEDSVC